MKIMKLYKKALLIVSLGLTLNSCLDLDPQDQLADGNLWGAADDFKYFARTIKYDKNNIFKRSIKKRK